MGDMMGSGADGTFAQQVAILASALETERHLHNWERWFAAAAVPDGEDHVADSILTSDVPFVVDGGADDWGVWLQILGATDTPAIAGNTKFDAHRLLFTAHEVNNNLYLIQYAAGASCAAALSAGTYTEFGVTTGGGNSQISPVGIIMRRRDIGTKIWIRTWASNQAGGGTLSFIHGIHEYPE